MHVLCVHFQWKKTNSSRHIGILSALRMRGLHDKRQLLAKLRIAGSEKSGKAFHNGFDEKQEDFFFSIESERFLNDVTYARFPLTLFLLHLMTQINGLPKKHHMNYERALKGLWSRHNSSLISRGKNKANFENACVSRNGHRIIKLLNQIQLSWYHSLLRKMLCI